MNRYIHAEIKSSQNKIAEKIPVCFRNKESPILLFPNVKID